MKTKTVLSSMLFMCFTLMLHAQNDIIKPLSSGSVASLLADDKLTGVRILSSTEESLNIEISYEGYAEEGKRYAVSGSILDSKKQVIKELTAEPEELSRQAQAVDLHFKVSGTSQSANPYLDSKYIAISVQSMDSESEEDSDLLEDLSTLFGGSDSGGMLSTATQFEYIKRWRIAGNVNMVIQATLTPIGKAIQ